MKYYKIILNLQIIGVGTTNNCLRFQPKHSALLLTTDDNAEYIECNKHLYHAQWMKPIITNIYQYEIADVISIEEQEYNALAPAIDGEPIWIDNEEVEPVVVPEVNPAEEITIDFIRKAKIDEMSYACRTTIEAGIDIELRGETKHFSLDTQDQLNLISLSAMAQTQSLIPYHADGEECTFYTSEEINEIVETATAFKIYHTTYYNALKTYINALGTIEEIAAITYGVEIPDEYKSDVLKVLEQ